MLKIITICIACVASFNSITMGQTEGDDCDWPIDATLGSNSFSTSNATSSSPLPDESMCEGEYLDWGSKNPDVWFKFTPSSNGNYKFTTCDPSGFGNYDTSMVLYEGSCDDQVACNGDASDGTGCQDYYSSIDYTLAFGYDYYIRIGGWQGDSGQGTLTISEAGSGDLQGACCVDYGNGKYYCYVSTRDDCIAEGGEWTKGATCNDISCGDVTSSVWYINVNNTNPGDGTTWGSAFLDLQDALDVASSGNQIWMAQGTYYPSDTDGSADAREASYRLIAGIEIYGGFLGNETDISEKLPRTYRVYLSGDLNGDDDGSGDNSENAYHVVTVDGLNGASPMLNGVTIQAGNANVAPGNTLGGGVLIKNTQFGSTILKNCFITNNGAIEGSGVATQSSGNEDTLILLQCLLLNNTASSKGGAIACYGFMTLESCLIVGNHANEYGGAMYIDTFGDSYNVHVYNSTIVQNTAGFGGGVYGTYSSCSEFRSCILWDNTDIFGNHLQLVSGEYNGVSGGCALFDVSHSCIQWGWGSGEANVISKNPRFTNALGNDGIAGTGDENFRLFQQSPCIDAGDNSYISDFVDFAGNNRMIDDPYSVDSGSGTPPIVDMGAYEHVTGADGNGVLLWSGASSSYFWDPENWLPGGYPNSDSDVLFNGDPTNQGHVLFDQGTYLNSLHVTEGTFTFDLNDNILTLRGSNALRIDPYGNEASAIFKGPGEFRSLHSIDLNGNIGFINGCDMYISELILNDGASLNFDGWLYGNLANENSTILPGGPGIGYFSIVGTLSSQDGSNSTDQLVGSLAFDIAGYVSGQTHDHLSVSQSADLSTAIELRWNNEFIPYENDSFDLMDVGSSTGTPSLIYNTGLPSHLKCSWSNPVAGARGTGEALVETTGPILFETEGTYELADAPVELVVADLDGDGDADIAMIVSTGDWSNGNVVILINDGMSGEVWQVSELTPIEVGMYPRDIAVMDVNNDGSADDLVVANYSSSTISVLVNDGTATFTKSDFGTDGFPKHIAIANFAKDNNGDEHDDIAVACESFLVNLLKNNTSFVGTVFADIGSIGISQPADILPGDVNNDKDFDFVILSSSDEELEVIEGDGIGFPSGFYSAETSSLPSGSGPVEFGFADLDRDGNEDAITINEGNGTISVLLGNAVTFRGDSLNFGTTSTVSVGTSPQDITVEDFDNDGDEDFVISVVGISSGSRELAIVRNDTPLLDVIDLSQSSDTIGSGSEPILVNHGDFNNDGLQDLASFIDLTPGGKTSTPAIAIYLNTTAVVVDCPADVDGNGSVAVNDLLALIAAWGSVVEPLLDLDGSGVVDVGDLLVVIGAWGPC